MRSRTEKLVKRLIRKLPRRLVLDAAADDVCAEIEITWREWALIKTLEAEFEFERKKDAAVRAAFRTYKKAAGR